MRQPDPIFVRHIPFEFPDDIKPHWNPRQPELSHAINGASLTMPYLEPFLIKTIQRAIPEIKDPALRTEALAFCAQEAQHYKTHRRFNELLKKNGYPELAAIEELMARDYQKMAALSLQKQLAYSAGFETMTIGVTNAMIKNRRIWLSGADQRVVSFLLWHMVEEMEHKTVAWRVYQEVTPGPMRRAIGVVHGTWHVLHFTRQAYILMLKKDGRWQKLSRRLQLLRFTSRFLLAILPALLRGMMPWHNPARVPNLLWVQRWISGYASADKNFVPLIDTDDPDMPPPFPQAAPAE